MEEEERKQKLKAGKEKLAKFQKKKKSRHPKHETQSRNEIDRQNNGVSLPVAGGASSLKLEGDLLSLSSFSEDEPSGTEEDESDSKSLVLIKSRLREKTERVEELEENLVGKQLALDKVIKENEKLRQEIEESKKVQDTAASQSSSELPYSKISGDQSIESDVNQSAEMSGDKSTRALEDQSESGSQLYTMAEVRELIQHVQWLQLQLKQAGLTLQAQEEKQAATTEALKQAKTEILALQDNMVTKDAIVTQLADKLTTISAEYGNLKTSLAAKNAPNKHNVSDDRTGEDTENADKISELTNQVDKLERELRCVHEKAELDKNDLMKALTIVKDNNETSLKENEILKLENENTYKKLQAVLIEKDSLVQNFESAKLKLDEIICEFDKVSSDKKLVDAENMKLSEQNSSLINELEEFERTNAKMVIEIESLKSEKIQTDESLKQLYNEIQKLTEINNHLETKNSSLAIEIHELKREKDEVNSELKELINEVSEVRGTNRTFESNMSEMSEQLENLTKENESYQRNSDQIGAEVETLKLQCQTQITQISEYQSQIEDYEHKISEATEAVEENQSLRTQNDELYNKINNQKDIIAALKAEIEGVLHKNLQLIEQLQDSVSSEELSRHDIEMLQKEKGYLKEELKNVKELLTETQNENDVCKKKIDVLNVEIEALKQDLLCSSVEQEEFRNKHDSLTSENSKFEAPVSEEYFTKESVSSSEAMQKKSSDPITSNEQPTNSTFVSSEETFLTATDLSLLGASSWENDTINNETAIYNINKPETKTDEIKLAAELQKQNEMLREELLKLQAKNIVKNAVEVAQASVHLETEHSEVTKASEETKELDETSDSVSATYTVVLGNVHDDTAYQTQETDQLERICISPNEIESVREQLSTLQGNYDQLKRLLSERTYECEMLQTELAQRGEAVMRIDYLDNWGHENLPAMENSTSHHIDNTEVSGGVASGLEVNLHASPTLPSTLGFCSVLNSSLGTVDVQFQNKEIAVSVEDTDRRRLQEDIDSLRQTVESQSQEKRDLVASLEKERKKLHFAICESEKFEELIQKYAKDLDNQTVVNTKLKETIVNLESEIKDLNHENEELNLDRHKIELKLSCMEETLNGMKVERSGLELRSEQVKDEISVLKDRLEYLESLERDTLEMREVIDSIQIEKENILKENEQLQNVISIKEQEYEKNLQEMEYIQQQYLELKEKMKTSKQDNMKLVSDMEETVSELNQIKHSLEDLGQQNFRLNSEMEGLVEENSTLKTKNHNLEIEVQNLTTENEKLQSYFPNIDSHEEHILLMEDKCKNLENQAEEVRESNEKMVLEITDLEKKLITVSDENEILLNKCEEMVTIIADMDNEKTDMLETIETLKIKQNEREKEMHNVLQKKENEMEALVEENSTLKTQVNNIKEDLKEVTGNKELTVENISVEIIKKKNTDLEKKNTDLEKSIGEYQEKVETLEYDILELIEKVQLYDDTISEKADLATRLEQEVNSLLEENSTLKTKNNSLEHELNELTESQNKQRDISKASNAPEIQIAFIEELSDRLELEAKCKSKLQRDVEVLQSQISQSESKVRNVEDERDLLKSELALHKSDWLKKEEYCRRLESEKESLLKETDHLKENIIAIGNNQKVNLDRLETLTVELQTCKSHLQAVSDNRNHVRIQIEILAAEMDALTASRDDTESKYSRLENEYAKLKTENKKAEALIEALENENSILKSENDKYSKLMASVQERIAKLDVILDKNQELASRNEMLSKKIDVMESQVEIVKTEKVELEKMMEELTNLLHDMQTKYEEVKSEMETTKKNCDKEIKHLQTQLQRMNDDVHELRNMLDIMENEVYDANEQKQVLKENLQQQECQYEEVVERKQKLEEMLSEKHQKDVQNKRTVCEEMTNRTNDKENGMAAQVNFSNICQMCQNSLELSSVSTFTQTDFPLAGFHINSRSVTAAPGILDNIPNQDDSVTSALHEHSGFDSDKDEDTQEYRVQNLESLIQNASTHRMDNEYETVVTADFECQVKLQKERDALKFVLSEIELNSYIPTEFEENLAAEVKDLQVLQENQTCENANGTENKSENQELTLNLECAEIDNKSDEENICSKKKQDVIMNVVNEDNESEISRNSLQNDLEQLNSVLGPENIKRIIETMDVAVQTETVEAKSDMCENCFETPSDRSHQADLSMISVDSGVFSTATGPKFVFDDNIQQKDHDIDIEENCDNSQKNQLCDMHSQTENNVLVELLDMCCQTDTVITEDVENTRKELEEKYEAMCSELETKIEDRVKKQLDFREQKIKMQEDQFENTLKQTEYEMEEKYKLILRNREAEIMVEDDLRRKLYQKEVDDMAYRKIEQMRMEKDQQFVETMQKVRADMKKQHKKEIAKLKEKFRDVTDHVGPGGEDVVDRDIKDQSLIQKLNEENEDLATARDALLRRADVYSQHLQALHLDLQGLMADQHSPEPPQAGCQGLPSWLDWEIHPELSYGSLNSSVDEISLSGSVHQHEFCTNSDCLNVRVKYEQLIERIKKFLSAGKVESSISLSNTSTPRGDISENEEETDQDEKDIDMEIDRFVENTDPEIPMIQRITSIHLEHSVRVPYQDESRHDEFVSEDVTHGEETSEINETILNQVIKESEILSKGIEEKESRNITKPSKSEHTNLLDNTEIDGHFSETDSDTEVEEFSEGSVTIDYDQFESFTSESGKGVTDKNVHPFHECKYAKSVIRRHMSENELSDDDEPELRSRSFSDSNIRTHFLPKHSVIQKKDHNESNSEGLFVHEDKNASNEGELYCSDTSVFHNVNDNIFNGTEKSKDMVTLPFGQVETIKSSVKCKLPLRSDRDEFIVEMSPMEENPPGSATSLVLDENEKAIGEDRGDFFQEAPVVRNKIGRPLMDLNFKFQSYSHDKEELKEITEQKIIPQRRGDKFSAPMSAGQDVNVEKELEQSRNYLTRNELSLCEEISATLVSDGESIFIGEENHESGDILENIAMDPPPVSEERQSYENTIFDVLNAICPGTNPIRIEKEDMVNPVIQNLENTAHDFSDSFIDHDIPALYRQIQSLEKELNALKVENENLSEQVINTEKIQQILKEKTEELRTLKNQNDETEVEFERISFLKGTLEQLVTKLQNEKESLQQLQVSSQEEMQLMKTNNDLLYSELKSAENIEKENVDLSASLSELKSEKEELEKSVSELKVMLDKQQKESAYMNEERDKVTVDKMDLQSQLEKKCKEQEENMEKSKYEQGILQQKLVSFSNHIEILEKENDKLERQVHNMEEDANTNHLKIKEMSDQLLTSDKEKMAITAELEILIIKSEQEKEEFSQRIKCLTEENSKSHENLEKTTSLNENLELTIKELQTGTENLKQENLRSEKEMEKIKMQNQELQMKQDKMEKQNKKCADVVSQLEMQKMELENLLSDLKIKLEIQEAELMQINSEKEQKLEFKLDQQRKEWGKKDMEQSAIISELEKKLALSSSHYAEIEMEKIALEANVSQIVSNNESKEKKLTEEVLSLKQKNEALDKEIKKLTTDHKSQESLILQEKEQLNEKIKVLEEVNSSLHEKACELKIQIDQINADSETLIRHFDLKVGENKVLERELLSAKSAVGKLNEIVAGKDNENKLLSDKIDYVQTQNISLRDCLAALGKASASEKLESYSKLTDDQQSKQEPFKNSQEEMQKELSVHEEKIDSLTEQTILDDDKTDRLEKSTGSEDGINQELNSSSTFLKQMSTIKAENDSVQDELKVSKETSEENTETVDEIASQEDQLQHVKVGSKTEIESLVEKMKHLNEQCFIQDRPSSEKIDVFCQTENTESCMKEIQSDLVFQADSADLNLEASDFSSIKKWQVKYEESEQKNNTLLSKVQHLEKEKMDLKVLITYNRETHEKEKTELLDMYSDLKNEVDSLIETKKGLEDELQTLRELLENGIDLDESVKSRELTIEDLEEMEELKSSIEHLKNDMKEKDCYVRKLEEHLLNLDRGLPDFTSTPKPTASSGEPVVSNRFPHKRMSFHDFGQGARSIDKPHHTELKHEQAEIRIADKDKIKLELNDSNASTISETKFVSELNREAKDPFRSSICSDTESVPSDKDTSDLSDRIRTPLQADAADHYAQELKQFELVDEIAKLRKDFRETKAIYEQETALLSEALERENLVTENMKIRRANSVDVTSDKGLENTLSADLLRARQDIALLRRENNILRIENERWLNRIKEQEQIVQDLRERLARNTSDIEEVEDVFGRQLALLQKQREELLDQVKDCEQENAKLSVTLGEKSISEESLRTEKEILSGKLKEKAALEKELADKQIELEKHKLNQKQFEEVVYQKDLNEKNLMKQKRLLEEELLEIESKFRDREETLGYEKKQMLDELREKCKKQKAEAEDSQDEVRSVNSESSVSDQQISRLELMLEEVEKEHKRAVKILRDQLQSKYNRHAKRQREEYVGALQELQKEQEKQVNDTVSSLYQSTQCILSGDGEQIENVSTEIRVYTVGDGGQAT